mgnify:CR=1 FL=1
MGILAVLIDSGDLLMTIAASFVAGLGVALVSSLSIWGGAKYVDYSQEGRTMVAAMALGVGVLGLLATVGIIVLGIYLMVAG